MLVEQWSMVSPNKKWFNRTEYRLYIHVIRVKEQVACLQTHTLSRTPLLHPEKPKQFH
jgi:hypothetical protein